MGIAEDRRIQARLTILNRETAKRFALEKNETMHIPVERKWKQF